MSYTVWIALPWELRAWGDAKIVCNQERVPEEVGSKMEDRLRGVIGGQSSQK